MVRTDQWQVSWFGKLNTSKFGKLNTTSTTRINAPRV